MEYQELLNDFVIMCREVIGADSGAYPAEGESAGLKSRLTGIYLHGSMAMGCFNPEKSDIDIIVVTEGEISDRQRLRFMEQVVRLNERAPAKGLELSIVNRKYCKPFVYPTPYELHFSPVHLGRYLESPEHYIKNMKGRDRDLAAHFSIINRCGITLYGQAVSDVFGEVPKEDYLDSIWCDVENAVEDIQGDFVYVVLNLCRTAAFLREGRCLSKAEGGQWGLQNLSGRYRGLILGALASYRAGAAGGIKDAGRADGVGEAGDPVRVMWADGKLEREFAESMLGEIRAGRQACAAPEEKA